MEWVFFAANVVVDKGVMRRCFVTEYENSLWIVSKWSLSPDGEPLLPLRIIRLEQGQYQDLRNRGYQFDFLVNEPIPTDVFDGPAEHQGRHMYDVRVLGAEPPELHEA